jgi:hypothetical protein
MVYWLLSYHEPHQATWTTPYFPPASRCTFSNTWMVPRESAVTRMRSAVGSRGGPAWVPARAMAAVCTGANTATSCRTSSAACGAADWDGVGGFAWGGGGGREGKHLSDGRIRGTAFKNCTPTRMRDMIANYTTTPATHPHTCRQARAHTKKHSNTHRHTVTQSHTRTQTNTATHAHTATNIHIHAPTATPTRSAAHSNKPPPRTMKHLEGVVFGAVA